MAVSIRVRGLRRELSVTASASSPSRTDGQQVEREKSAPTVTFIHSVV